MNLHIFFFCMGKGSVRSAKNVPGQQFRLVGCSEKRSRNGCQGRSGKGKTEGVVQKLGRKGRNRQCQVFEKKRWGVYLCRGDLLLCTE